MSDDGPSPATTGSPPVPDGGGHGALGKSQPSLGDVFWVGTACAISIVAGGGIGYGIDDAVGTLPWFTIGGLVFGVVSGVLIAVNQFRKYV